MDNQTIFVPLHQGGNLPIVLYPGYMMPEGYLCLEYREIISNADSKSMCLDSRYLRDVVTAYKEERRMPEEEHEPEVVKMAELICELSAERAEEALKRLKEMKPEFAQAVEAYMAVHPCKGDPEEMDMMLMARQDYARQSREGGGMSGFEQGGGSAFIPQAGVPLHRFLQEPYNVGVFCRVRNPIGFKMSDIFKTIYGMISRYHRVYFCPMRILRHQKFNAPMPWMDPLVTYSYHYRPWIWEGCIPFAIRASLDPASVGLHGMKPLLGIAVSYGDGKPIKMPSHGMREMLSWQMTVELIQQSFSREAAGGFTSIHGDWIPYTGQILPVKMTPEEALAMFGIKDEMLNVTNIHRLYRDLAARMNPEDVSMEENPHEWEDRIEYNKRLAAAWERIMMARLVAGRRLHQIPAEAEKIAAIIMNRLVWMDLSKKDQGIVRVVWRKDAPEIFGLRAKTLKFFINDEQEFDFASVSDILKAWVQKLYIDPYKAEGYTPRIQIEGLPSEVL